MNLLIELRRFIFRYK